MIIKNSEAPVTIVDQLPDWVRTAEPIPVTDKKEEVPADEPAQED